MDYKTNDAGYVTFPSRNYRYRGDKGSWARAAQNKAGEITSVTVKRAGRGILSSAYEVELDEFCAQYGIDWASVDCGQSVTVEVLF